MRRLSSFTTISLDGFFSASDGDFRWAHNPVKDAEWDAFVAGNAKGGGMLVFGRITYDIMKSYWPTPMAMQNDPVVAGRMNGMQKIVFSHSLEPAAFSKTAWSNTRLVQSDMVDAVRKLKQESGDNISGDDMSILGSGSLVSQLARAGLIDEFQIVVNPIILGQGRSLFAGVKKRMDLKLTESRSFNNGNTFLRYEPR